MSNIAQTYLETLLALGALKNTVHCSVHLKQEQDMEIRQY
jgi:hypothetical protein